MTIVGASLQLTLGMVVASLLVVPAVLAQRQERVWLYGSVIDPRRPITGASVCGTTTDSEGRFTLSIVTDWTHRGEGVHRVTGYLCGSRRYSIIRDIGAPREGCHAQQRTRI